MAKNKKIELTQKMVHASTAFGVLVVREMANESLSRQPQMSLKQFMTVLDNYERQTANVTPLNEVIHL